MSRNQSLPLHFHPSCDRSISQQHDSNSVYPPTTSDDVTLMNHDYADPAELKNAVKYEMENLDRQKRQNLIYEPMRTEQRKQKDLNNNPEKSSKCHVTHLCIVLLFVVSSCSLALSLLITLGKIETKSSLGTGGMYVPTSEALVRRKFNSKQGSDVTVNEMKQNMSQLSGQVPLLLQKLASLEASVKLYSANGGQSTTNDTSALLPDTSPTLLATCTYKTEVGHADFTNFVPYDKTSVTTSWVKTRPGYQVVGGSCTTHGGAQYEFHQKEMNDFMWYRCKCAGKTHIEAFKSDELECRMHYWECPTSTM